MDVDLEAHQVTDIHCFSFSPGKPLTNSSLSEIFLSGGPTVRGFRGEVHEKDLAASVAYGRMIRELSSFLRTRNAGKDVLRRRRERAEDFAGYVGALFRDARIIRAVLDNGIEPVGFEEFQKYVPARLYRVFRLEPLLKSLFESAKTFGELCASFDEAITSAVRKRGYVGFKSVAAYRTGLDIQIDAEAEARVSFREYRKGRYEGDWFGPRIKPVRDFLLCRAAESSRRLGAFLQIHTGVGDTDVVAPKCDPLLLREFLKSESVSKTPVILIHGGFPYTLQAAWLANVFPNVYFELSAPLPPIFLPALSKNRFRDVLEIVPATRIVYGSDAIEIPENHWLSAKLAKRALGGALGDLVREGALGSEEAHRFGKLILHENATKLLR